MDQDLFVADLKKVLKRHKVWLSGTVKIREINGGWDEKTAECIITEIINYGYARDTSGAFVNFNIIPVEVKNNFSNRKVSTVIMDRDKLLANGVLSPLDQKTTFHNRKDWGEHLKANGCVEIGNDFNKSIEKPREIKGDFDCRDELGKVTHQVMDKYGN